MNTTPRFYNEQRHVLFYGLLLAVLVSCSSSGIFRRELVFTKEDLQSKLTKKFPRKEKHPLMSVTFSNPEILLEPGAHVMGIQLDVKMAPRLGKQLMGRVLAEGEIEYRPQHGEFFIVNPKLRKIEFENLKEKYEKDVRSISDRIVEQYLSEVPVYRLDQRDFKQKVAKLVLKSVEIKDGKLVIVIGL